jgi:hypothetical protein
MNWLLVPVFAFILGLWLFVTGVILYGIGGDQPGLLIAAVLAVGALSFPGIEVSRSSA